jgi:hypothetical protein
MPESLHHSPQEFWRPPAIHTHPQPPLPAVVVCRRCRSEFIAGARFCHNCGAPRISDGSFRAALKQLFEPLEFHKVQAWSGLPTVSLTAFLIGIGCGFAGIAVGFIYPVQNFSDFEAVQLWRIEWLLAAVAAFVAGILLKKAGSIVKK